MYNRIVSSSSSSVELTGVVADCFKFCGTMHARHTQLMSPRLCTTKHFTMTQLKLFTLVGVANLMLEG